ncbi:TPA: hypothetical protein EYG96_01260, partial [Candidatus Gracilibacteria bacterium]|nr:hypothetical protein [Candidatus Gracilibacteria bacterium]
TTEAPSKYTGPISAVLQKCLDTPLTAAEKTDETIYAPYNRGAKIDQTRSEILADIGPVLGHAVTNNEINWQWDGLSKTYKFKGHEDDSKLWYCYFKEDSPFFKEFLSEDQISVPFNDITTISFKEIIPVPAENGGFERPESALDGFSGMIGGIAKLAHLKSFEDGVLQNIKSKFALEGEKFSSFNSFSKFDSDLVSPKLGSLDFWDEVENQKSEIQKVIKITPNANGETIISLGEIAIDTTKEFDVQNLEAELVQNVKFEKVTDTATGKEKILIKLSETAVSQNSNVQSYITSLKIKEVGDQLATIINENAEQGKVKDATATFEIVVRLANNVPAGIQYQAVIAGNILSSVLNENGQTITNPLITPIFSEIIEIDGAEASTCTGAEVLICGVESPAEAVEAEHTTLNLKSYANVCEFEESGAKFFDMGACDTEDNEKYAKQIAEYTAQ